MDSAHKKWNLENAYSESELLEELERRLRARRPNSMRSDYALLMVPSEVAQEFDFTNASRHGIAAIVGRLNQAVHEERAGNARD